LEDAVEHRADAAAGLGDGVGFLELAEDLGLAEHLRVESGGDGDGVFDRAQSVGGVADAREAFGGDGLEFAEGLLESFAGVGGFGDAVDFDAVAGVEHGDLAQAGQGGEGDLERVHLGGVEREFFTQLERRGVVAGAEHEELGGAAHRAVETADGSSGGWRLELTGPSESNASAKRMMQVQARRLAMTISRSRSPQVTA